MDKTMHLSYTTEEEFIQDAARLKLRFQGQRARAQSDEMKMPSRSSVRELGPALIVYSVNVTRLHR